MSIYDKYKEHTDWWKRESQGQSEEIIVPSDKCPKDIATAYLRDVKNWVIIDK